MKRVRLHRAESVDRRSFLLDQARGATVLHLGCADHPFLDERLASGSLLHRELQRVTSALYGIDVDGRALERMRAAGFDDLFVGDLEHLEAVKLDRRFDVIIAGEVVEHLANPGLFLRGVPRFLARDGRLIVTVPSAQSIRLASNALRRREIVHPDHNAYYSPQTLQHLLESHGFEILDLRPYWTEARKRPVIFRLYDQAVRLTRFISPWLGEGLIATVRNARLAR